MILIKVQKLFFEWIISRKWVKLCGENRKEIVTSFFLFLKGRYYVSFGISMANLQWKRLPFKEKTEISKWNFVFKLFKTQLFKGTFNSKKGCNALIMKKLCLFLLTVSLHRGYPREIPAKDWWLWFKLQ